ncbi:MAG: zinc ribbon domain-containing protein [Bacillota bacterium]
MSVRCSQCGTISNTGGNFCPQCGSPLSQPSQQQAPPPPPPPPPAASYQPPAPPYQPPTAGSYQPPAGPYGHPTPPWQAPPVAPRKSGGAGKWILIILGVVAALVVGLVALVALMPEPVTDPAASGGTTPGTKPAAPAPKPDPAPSQSAGSGVKVTLVKKGAMPSKQRGSFYAPYGSYLAEGSGSRATLYRFNASGDVSILNTAEELNAGKLLDVSLGDMLNAGTPVMVATFEQKILVVAPTGQPQVLNNTGTQRVLMGDYDGDGKTETIFLGERFFNVHRYEKGGDTRPIYSKKDAAQPFPQVFATRQKAGDRELLTGYAWEGEKLSLLLYKWDGLGGPVVIGQYPVSKPETAEWMGSAPTALGPTFVLARSGSPAQVEFFTLSKDAKSATSRGQVKAEGVGRVAIGLSNFTGQSTQLITIDENGTYYLYNVSPK